MCVCLLFFFFFLLLVPMFITHKWSMIRNKNTWPMWPYRRKKNEQIQNKTPSSRDIGCSRQWPKKKYVLRYDSSGELDRERNIQIHAVHLLRYHWSLSGFWFMFLLSLFTSPFHPYIAQCPFGFALQVFVVLFSFGRHNFVFFFIFFFFSFCFSSILFCILLRYWFVCIFFYSLVLLFIVWFFFLLFFACIQFALHYIFVEYYDLDTHQKE